MRGIRSFHLLLAVALVFQFAAVSCRAADKTKMRPAGVAGSFYPSDPAQLTADIDRYLKQAAEPPLSGGVLAIIAPHAGYQFSGPVAAYSYAAIRGKTFRRVIVIAPSHFAAFSYSSVYDGDAYATPLGNVPVDKEFAARLAAADPSIKLGTAGHEGGQQPEHSLEDQLPFLQRAIGSFQLVPIVMGDPSYDNSRALGMALAKLLANDDSTLIVASSDLSHYLTYDQASRMDRGLLASVADGDFLTVSRNVELRVWYACGYGPIVAAMIAAEHLGATRAQLLKYANSGDITGDKSRVVGYGAVAFVRDEASAKPVRIVLSGRDRDDLLKIARTSVESMVRDRKPYAPTVPTSEALLQPRGVFVTLTIDGQLRGCIGYVSPVEPLYLAVRDVAALAAVRDTRFSPVAARELPNLQYEISVLSPFHHVLDVKDIKVGQDGLLIRRQEFEGVFLPQVPIEQGWNRATYLEEIGLKAGLPRDAWKDEAADLFTFTALVFADHPTDIRRGPAEDETPLPSPRSLGDDRPHP